MLETSGRQTGEIDPTIPSQPVQVSYKQREQVWYNHSTRQCLDHDNAIKCEGTQATVVLTPLETVAASGKSNTSSFVWIMAIQVTEAHEFKEENNTTARRYIVSHNNPMPISPCEFAMKRQGTATGSLYCQKDASVTTRSIMLSVIKQITPKLQARLYSAGDGLYTTSTAGSATKTTLAEDSTTATSKTSTSTATTTTTTTTESTTTTTATIMSTTTTTTVEEDENFDPNGKVALHRAMAVGPDGNISVTVAYDQGDYKEWRNTAGMRPENMSYTETAHVDKVSGQTASSQSQSVMHDRSIMGTNASDHSTNTSVGYTAQSTVTVVDRRPVDDKTTKNITDQLTAMDGQHFPLSGIAVENATTTNNTTSTNSLNASTASTGDSIPQKQNEPVPVDDGSEEEAALAAVREEQEAEVTKAFALAAKAKGEARNKGNRTRHARCNPPPSPPRAAAQQRPTANVLTKEARADLISTTIMGKPVGIFASLSAGLVDECSKWVADEQGLDTRWQNDVETAFPCPCNEKDVQNNVNWSPEKGRFRPYTPWRLGRYHPGADDCYRSAATANGHGQQCCYANNRLITRGPGGGTMDKAHFSSSEHKTADVLPFNLCGESEGWRTYTRFRPISNSNQCADHCVEKAGESKHCTNTVDIGLPINAKAGVSFVVNADVSGSRTQLYGASKTMDVGTTRRRRSTLPSISKTLKLFSGCIPTPIAILRLCASLSAFVQAGIALTTDTTEMKIEPYLRAGFMFEAKVSAWIAEVGVFATGTLVDLAMPASVSLKEFAVQDLSKARVCLRWVSKPAHLAAFYYTPCSLPL